MPHAHSTHPHRIELSKSHQAHTTITYTGLHTANRPHSLPAAVPSSTAAAGPYIHALGTQRFFPDPGLGAVLCIIEWAQGLF